jgi:hypothetical protein
MGADTVTTIEGNVNAGNALESQQALIGQHAAAQQQQLVDEIARHRELARQLKSPSGGGGPQGGGNPGSSGPGSGPAQLPPPQPVPVQNPSVNLPVKTDGSKPPVGGGNKPVLEDDGAIDLPPQKVLPPPQTDPVPKTRPQKTQPPDEGVIADPPPVKKEKPSALPNPDADKYNGIAERAADQMALGQEVTEKTLTALAKADGVPMTPTRAKIMLDRLNRAKTSATQEGVAKADFGTHVRKTTKAGQHYAVPGSLLLAAIAGGSRRSDASEQDGPIMRALRGFGGQR